MSFNIDEQIFMRNDKTDKVYTLTLNKNSGRYDVTREWTIPNQSQLASKTDSFPLFKQAAEFIEKHYKERIQNGYIEVMRRVGVVKINSTKEQHKISEIIIPPDKPPSNTNIYTSLQARHRTGIHDRLDFLKHLKK